MKRISLAIVIAVLVSSYCAFGAASSAGSAISKEKQELLSYMSFSHFCETTPLPNKPGTLEILLWPPEQKALALIPAALVAGAVAACSPAARRVMKRHPILTGTATLLPLLFALIPIYDDSLGRALLDGKHDEAYDILWKRFRNKYSAQFKTDSAQKAWLVHISDSITSAHPHTQVPEAIRAAHADDQATALSAYASYILQAWEDGEYPHVPFLAK